jgi:hypothetical protein
MKAITASFLLGSTLALIACSPPNRADDGPGDDDDTTGPDAPTVTASACSKMDIVFVIDDSGSMEQEQSNLATNFPMFATLLQNYTNPDGEHVDFRIAVTTTGRELHYTTTIDFMGQQITTPNPSEGFDNGAFREGCGVNKRWLEPNDPGFNDALACRANVGTGGSSDEMPLLMSKWALADRIADGTNAGFLRDDALLGVVMLTDEDDTSTTQDNFNVTLNPLDPNGGGFPIDFNPADEIAFLDGLKGHRSRWAAGVIAGESSCTSSFGDAVEASRLKQFVQMANANGSQQAVFSSICAGDLTAALNDVLNKFQAACGGIIL